MPGTLSLDLYDLAILGVLAGLPHTTYRLPLGTPWRVLVPRSFFTSRWSPLPITKAGLAPMAADPVTRWALLQCPQVWRHHVWRSMKIMDHHGIFRIFKKYMKRCLFKYTKPSCFEVGPPTFGRSRSPFGSTAGVALFGGHRRSTRGRRRKEGGRSSRQRAQIPCTS